MTTSGKKKQSMKPSTIINQRTDQLPCFISYISRVQARNWSTIYAHMNLHNMNYLANIIVQANITVQANTRNWSSKLTPRSPRPKQNLRRRKRGTGRWHPASGASTCNAQPDDASHSAQHHRMLCRAYYGVVPCLC
jgi:hypothetical protein